MKPPIDDATAAEMRRLLKAGGKIWEVAERFGVSPAEARAATDRRLRALARRESKAVEANTRADARLAVARERRAVEAGRMVEARRRRGAAERRAAREAARDEEIRRLWTEGSTGRALAARYGMAPSKVSGIVAGLPRPLRYASPEFAPRIPPAPKVTPPPDFPAAPLDPGDRLVGDGKAYAKGSSHPRAKLDEAGVIEMRRLRSEGWSTGRLAERFGIGRNTICYALAGKTWRHVGAKGGTSC